MANQNFSIPAEIKKEWEEKIAFLASDGKSHWEVYSAMLLLLCETPDNVVRYYASEVSRYKKLKYPFKELMAIAESGLLRKNAQSELAKRPNSDLGAIHRTFNNVADRQSKGRKMRDAPPR